MGGEEIEAFADWLHGSFHPDGKPLTDEKRKKEAAKLLSRLDEKKGNNDGRFEFAEVDVYITQKINEIDAFKAKQALKDNNRKLAESIINTFSVCDTDGTGVIPASQLEAVFSEISDLTGEDIRAIIGHGDIDYKKFCKWCIEGKGSKKFHVQQQGPG